MQVPEALIDRPLPRRIRPKGSGAALVPPTSLEVLSRRKKACSLGEAIPRTYLLQPIVEAFNITLKDIYNAAKEKKWDDATRKEEIKKALTALPLKLDDHTNYEDAFRTPAFINPTNFRIYHGTGSVEPNEIGFVVSSNANAKIKGKLTPFKVAIVGASGNECSPKSHLTLHGQLQKYATEKKEFRWYAYGKPEMHSDTIILNVSNLDYLYLKDAYQK
jgi:hypothetical protein